MRLGRKAGRHPIVALSVRVGTCHLDDSVGHNLDSRNSDGTVPRFQPGIDYRDTARGVGLFRLGFRLEKGFITGKTEGIGLYGIPVGILKALGLCDGIGNEAVFQHFMNDPFRADKVVRDGGILPGNLILGD